MISLEVLFGWVDAVLGEKFEPVQEVKDAAGKGVDERRH
jgi:hypothetical protein